MPSPTIPTLTVTQGGNPVTAGETVLAGVVLLVSLTGSTIPDNPPTAAFSVQKVTATPTADFTAQKV